MKVISYSLWGNNPKYIIGMLRNAELATSLYPDWQCWVYHPEDEQFDELKSMTNVRLIPVSAKGDWRGMFWRFEAIDHPDVDIMISRDCDSRLTLREKNAVYEWINSDFKFHTMHDHPYHTVPILGGMWGIKKGLINNFKKLINNWNQEDRWQTDQDFLQNIVWPLVQTDCINHASFHLNYYNGRPFPDKRQGLEFVGQVFDENEITVSDHLSILAKNL